MPRLTNQRQELFCQLLKRGIPPYRAYPMAGYKAHHHEPYRLRDKPGVKRRLDELNRSVAMKTQVTVVSITEDLDRITAGAEASEQWGAAKGAVEVKAKLHGLLIDRKESGTPGEFAGATTPEQIIEKVRAELGDEAAAALQAMVLGPPAALEPADQVALAVQQAGDETIN